MLRSGPRSVSLGAIQTPGAGKAPLGSAPGLWPSVCAEFCTRALVCSAGGLECRLVLDRRVKIRFYFTFLMVATSQAVGCGGKTKAARGSFAWGSSASCDRSTCTAAAAARSSVFTPKHPGLRLQWGPDPYTPYGPSAHFLLVPCTLNVSLLLC